MRTIVLLLAGLACTGQGAETPSKDVLSKDILEKLKDPVEVWKVMADPKMLRSFSANPELNKQAQEAMEEPLVMNAFHDPQILKYFQSNPELSPILKKYSESKEFHEKMAKWSDRLTKLHAERQKQIMEQFPKGTSMTPPQPEFLDNVQEKMQDPAEAFSKAMSSASARGPRYKAAMMKLYEDKDFQEKFKQEYERILKSNGKQPAKEGVEEKSELMFA